MNSDTIRKLIEKSFPVGTKIQNPGRGCTKIGGYNVQKVSYMRRSSRMYLPYKTILSVIKSFNGQEVSSKTVKEFLPEIFDSQARPAGHSCNGTTLFLLLKGIGFTERIEGRGKRGNPFKILINIFL